MDDDDDDDDDEERTAESRFDHFDNRMKQRREHARRMEAFFLALFLAVGIVVFALLR